MTVALVLGSQGFIGKNLVAHLKTENMEVYEESILDLRSLDNCYTALRCVDKQVDYCFNLASHNGGIAYNRENPFDIFYDNTMIALNVMRACAISKKVNKLISPVTSCGYPDWAENLDEMSYLLSNPECNIACHGYAKRNLQLACDFMFKQYKFNSITVCPNTVIGPHDCLKLSKTKVGMAVIKKIVDAKKGNAPSVEFWGTGEPLREFVYVGDVCKYMLHAARLYNQNFEPLNIGTGKNAISIKDYVYLVKGIVEYNGEIKWDTRKPDGQACKKLSYNKLNAFIENNHIPDKFTPLEESVRKTIEWYQSVC